jgi:hypothetical protein
MLDNDVDLSALLKRVATAGISFSITMAEIAQLINADPRVYVDYFENDINAGRFSEVNIKTYPPNNRFRLTAKNGNRVVVGQWAVYKVLVFADQSNGFMQIQSAVSYPRKRFVFYRQHD